VNKIRPRHIAISMHHNNQPLFKEDEKRRRVTASPFERKRRKEDDADSNDIPVAGASSTAAAACYELLSSSSDDEENKKNGITVRKEKTVTGAQQHQQRTGEWLTSLNVRRDDDSSSSSDDDSDVTKAAMERREWLTSSTAHTKLDHLTKIESSANKALQMLLWEIGFDYNVLAHQFEAIRFVAGVVKTFPLAADQSGHGKDDIGSDSDTIDRKNDNDINEMLALDFAGEMRRFNALKQHTNLIKTRGALLADEMGLGKTIEALGGAALRNHLIGVKGKSKTKKPTLIVTPQDGIQQQWYDALRRAGVEPARICVVGERKKDTKARCGSTFKSSTTQEGMYLLCTRYKIQSELKKLFEQTANLKSALKNSILFQHIPPALIGKLRNQYLAEKGKERNRYIRNWERRQDCITRLIRESFNDDKASFKTAFNSVIIDECHFLKNVIAYWGIGAALLGGQAKRTVLLSGTPYNNGPSDMSALMTFIDPRNKAAQLNWWEKAVGKGKKKDIAESVGHWRRSYMLRRQKDVLLELPARERKCVNIAPFPSELFIYENYEFAFLSALKKLQEAIDDGNPESIRKQKELCDIMMATMSCMRMALVHPLLPGGREITIQFSPSRRYLLKREENKEQCVLCSGRSYPTQRAEAFAARSAAEENGGEFIADEDYLNLVGADVRVRAEIDLDDDELDDEDVLSGSNTRVNMKKGQLVELNDNGICQAAGSDCRHFAHKKCLEVFLEHDGNQCPRCYDLRSRIHISNNDGVSTVSHRVCCSKTQTTVSDLNGFTASAKIVKTIEWFKTTVPDDEKAIILSFFKGSLDLVEGILSDELDIECARYDGDVGKDTRAADLKRFQTSSSCRVLLASVQSGGTGLNITQANHVCFLDRWFNPQVHDQAESRVHRIGQKKDVKISYLDTALTVDCVMKIVNEYKLDNASVLLADGTSLGDAPRGAVGYKDLSGVIGNSIKAIRDMRRHVIALNEQTGDGGLPIALPFDADQLFNKVQEVINSRPVKAKPKKEDGDVSSHGYESGDNAMFDEDVDDTVKGKSMKWHASQESSSSNDSILNYNLHAFVKPKPTKWPPSQESSSSNDSILNYDIHASVKNETKPTKLPLTQESSSSNDSILDYDIFSTKKPKTARSVNIGIDLERGSRRKDVIDLSLDDDGDDKHRATYAQTTLPLDPIYPR
jgi:SNF2 family DNA or RNA helicase